MGPLERQLSELGERFGEVTSRALPSGANLVTIAHVPVPTGWTKDVTSIRFMVPAGYPFAALDCFWADADLTLRGGRAPQNTAVQGIPETDESGLWFSWHLTQGWNANRDTLSSWMNTIIDRLRRPQ